MDKIEIDDGVNANRIENENKGQRIVKIQKTLPGHDKEINFSTKFERKNKCEFEVK